jgi:hypothetical protein
MKNASNDAPAIRPQDMNIAQWLSSAE